MENAVGEWLAGTVGSTARHVLVAPVIGVMFLVATVYSALGIIVASHISDMQGFQFVVNFLVVPMKLRLRQDASLRTASASLA